MCTCHTVSPFCPLAPAAPASPFEPVLPCKCTVRVSKKNSVLEHRWGWKKKNSAGFGHTNEKKSTKSNIRWPFHPWVLQHRLLLYLPVRDRQNKISPESRRRGGFALKLGRIGGRIKVGKAGWLYLLSRRAGAVRLGSPLLLHGGGCWCRDGRWRGLGNHNLRTLESKQQTTNQCMRVR